jgi:hypothetical protein
MKKLLIAGNLLFSFPLLAACGSDNTAPQEEKESGDTAAKDNQSEAEETNDPEENLLGSEKLQERIKKGMDVDAYSAELTAMEEKGKTAMLKRYNLPDNQEIKANILQSSDGFIAVETDGLEVTNVTSFKSMKEVEAHLKEKGMEEAKPQ